MTLSIIIVNWNTRALLADCLASIATTAGELTAEIIVSDNGSTDGSRDLCRERFPRVIFLENGANLGFAAANNRGLAIARGRYCLLLNSDTRVEPNALQNALAFMEAHPETGALGCKLITANGDVQRSIEKVLRPLAIAAAPSARGHPRPQAARLLRARTQPRRLRLRRVSAVAARGAGGGGSLR